MTILLSKLPVNLVILYLIPSPITLIAFGFLVTLKPPNEMVVSRAICIACWNRHPFSDFYRSIFGPEQR